MATKKTPERGKKSNQKIKRNAFLTDRVSVSTNTIDNFCKILHCDISDIMEFVDE